MRFGAVLILGILLSACSSFSSFELEEGDILFQDIDCGDFCESIETVTVGYHGAKFSHVAIYTKYEGEAYVLEAISEGVVRTHLDSFLLRTLDTEGQPKVIVGRLKNGKVNIKEAIQRAEGFLGSSYDDAFDISNDRYYCSELLYYSYLDSLQNPIFKLRPMTFKDPETNEIFPLWAEYFEKLEVEIPEGEAGLNPGGISLSPFIEIVHQYGRVDGLQE